MAVAGGEHLEVLAGRLRRAVVDDDDLVGELVGVGEHALEREPGAREVVEHRHHHARDRRRRGGAAPAGTGRPRTYSDGLVGELQRPSRARPRAAASPGAAPEPASCAACAGALAAPRARRGRACRRARPRGSGTRARPRVRRGGGGPGRACTAATASAASSRSANANRPSPVGSAAPNPVSWTITGRPGRQVGGAALAEPAAAEVDVLLLGGRDLARRADDVVAVVSRGPARARSPGRTRQPCSASSSRSSVVVARQRELDRAPRAQRQVEDLHELLVLAPAVDPALEVDVAVVAGASCRSS